MALTSTDLFEGPKAPNAGGSFGGLKVHIAEVVVGTYATGGLAFTAGDFEMAAIKFVCFGGPSTGGYIPVWDRANGKLMVFITKDPGAAGGANVVLQEVGNGVDLSAVKFQTLFLGTPN